MKLEKNLRNKVCTLLLLMMIFLFASSFASAISREDAELAIAEAEEVSQILRSAGHSLDLVNDSILAAKLAFSRAELAEESGDEALAEFTYDDVLEHTKVVFECRDNAFAVEDSIRALEIKLEQYGHKEVGDESPINILTGAFVADTRKEYADVSDVEVKLLQASGLLQEGKFDQAQLLVEEAQLDLEKKERAATVGNLVYNSTSGFLKRNLGDFLLVLVGVGLFSLVVYRPVNRMMIRRQVRKMDVEKTALQKMMKQTQHDRYVKGKIAGGVYDLRMDTYRERLNILEEKIPVLEAKLGRKRKTNDKKSK